MAKRADASIEVLCDHLEAVDKACRETWVADGSAITPDFIRKVLIPRVFSAIASGTGSIHHELQLLANRTRIGETDLTPALHHLAHKKNELEGDVSTRYEIEAIELAKQVERNVGGINAVRTVTAAPPPPASVGGFGLASYRPEPTEIPPNPPGYFPSDLWPQTNVILLEAQRKFPHQTQTLELCRHITTEMTPLFCEAVKTGKMTASAVLSKGLGGMEDLLHSLLVYNDDSPKSGLSNLSDEAYRLGKKVRQSDEWLALSKAVTDAHVARRTEGDRLRTGANQAESPVAQNIAPTPGQVYKSTSRVTAIGPNIDRLRKECGWSLDQLAKETGIDKKSVLSHVNKGVRPIPRILMEYAQAFSRALGRKITAPELEK